MTCQHTDIANMDFTRGGWPGDEEVTRHVNRLCMKCYQHWAGPVGAVVEYTRKDWDAHVDWGWEQEREQAT